MFDLSPQLQLIPEQRRELSLEALGVFAPNKDAPLHRWVSLTEGFSAQLVAQQLEGLSSSSSVFDPFGGTGTTPLVAAQFGHRGFWAEVNPYLQEAAAVKVTAASAPSSTRKEVVHELREAVLRGPLTEEVPEEHPLVNADGQRGFFPSGVAHTLVGWVMRFNALETELGRRAGRLAAASCAISVSNMKRAVDLRRRTDAELQRPRRPVVDAVRERIQAYSEDLATTPVAHGSAKWISEDARSLPADLGPIDRVITSPPYLNGTNYCRNTKLELLLLGLIQSEAELGAIRTRAVTAGINNVSQRIAEPETLACVEPVATRLDEVAYDVRIPKMVRAYFSDMRLVLAAVRDRMAPDGQLVLDIGDSRFAGVHVDTPSILMTIAESVGWRSAETTILRARTAKDGTRLCQKLLHLSLS